MRIKFLETLLRRYQRLSDLSGMSDRTQEETIDNILQELKKLYKKRNI